MGLRPDQERIVTQTVNIASAAASYTPGFVGELLSIDVAAVGGSASSATVTVDGVSKTAVALTALAGSQSYVTAGVRTAAAAKTAYDADSTDNLKWVSNQTQVGYEDLHPVGVSEQIRSGRTDDVITGSIVAGNPSAVAFDANDVIAVGITGATSGTVTFKVWRK